MLLKVMLVDFLVVSKSRQKQLLDATVARIAGLAKLHKNKRIPATSAFVHIEIIIGIITQLLEHQGLWAPFLGSGEIFNVLPPAVLSILQAHKTDGNILVWESAARCITSMLTLSLSGGMGTVSPVRLVRLALDGGILSAICTCIHKLPSSHPSWFSSLAGNAVLVEWALFLLVKASAVLLATYFKEEHK